MKKAIQGVFVTLLAAIMLVGCCCQQAQKKGHDTTDKMRHEWGGK